MFAFFDSHLMPTGTFSATLTTQGFWPQPLAVVCNLLLQAGCERPHCSRCYRSLISYAACCGTLMSLDQTWLGRSIGRPASRYG